MPKVLVLYYSSYGHIEQMADAIAEGARSVPGTEVAVKRVPELVPEDVARNVTIDFQPCAPALLTYTGVLYEAMGAADLVAAAEAGRKAMKTPARPAGTRRRPEYQSSRLNRLAVNPWKTSSPARSGSASAPAAPRLGAPGRAGSRSARPRPAAPGIAGTTRSRIPLPMQLRWAL